MTAPMLARNLEGDIEDLIKDRNWVFELKCNGDRKFVSGTEGRLLVYSRKGTRTDVPARMRDELETLVTIAGAIDCELVDGLLWAFDLPHCGTLITPATPWYERRAALEALLGPRMWDPQYVNLLPVARSTQAKRRLKNRVFSDGFEGLIAKRTDSRYEPGPKRPGTWLKHKNVRTVDCVVASFGEDKHNMQLEVYRDGKLVEIGECSRYEGEAPRAKIKDVVEVAFLDAGNNPDAPRLCQPHCKRIRTKEKAPTECTIDQLDGTFANKGVLV